MMIREQLLHLGVEGQQPSTYPASQDLILHRLPHLGHIILQRAYDAVLAGQDLLQLLVDLHVVGDGVSLCQHAPSSEQLTCNRGCVDSDTGVFVMQV